MTMPQNADQAPHRAQRFIELEATSENVPQFACCSIVNSYRPEKVGPDTPGGGPTVLQVKRPVKDSECGVVLNFACEIPAGARSKVGTADYPAYARIAGNPSPGDTIGPKEGSWELHEGYCGFVFLGDLEDGVGRVMHWDNCESLVPIATDECLYPGAINQTVRKLKWECNEFVDTGETLELCDPNCLLMLLPYSESNKEIAWVHCPRCDGNSYEENCCCTPIAPFGKTRVVKVESPIACKASGPAKVMRIDACGSYTETDCEITVCNDTNRKIMGKTAEDTIEFEYVTVDLFSTPDACLWMIREKKRAERALVTLDEYMCPSDTEKNATFVAWLDVCEWGETPPTKLKVQNILNISGCVNDLVEVRWDEGNQSWYAGAAQQHLVDLVTDISYSNCQIKKTVLTNIAVNACTNCTSMQSQLAIQLYNSQVVHSIGLSCAEGSDDASTSDDTCQLTMYTKQCCTFESSCGSLVPTTLVNGRWQTVLTDVEQVGTNIDGDFTDVCVLCIANDWSETLVEGTLCEDEDEEQVFQGDSGTPMIGPPDVMASVDSGGFDLS